MLGRKYSAYSFTAENIPHSMSGLRQMPQSTCALIYYQNWRGPWTDTCERQEDCPCCSMLYGYQGSVSNAALELHASVWIIALKHFREFSTVFTGWACNPGTWALIEDIHVKHEEPESSFIVMVKWSVSVKYRVPSHRWLRGKIELS